MSFYSRPDHLRIPGPKDAKKSAENKPQSTIEDSVVEDSATSPDTAPEPEATGSALEAWSVSDTVVTSPAKPRVREQSVPRPPLAKAPAIKTEPTRPAKKAVMKPSVAPKPVAPSKPSEQEQTEDTAAQQRNLEAHRETRILVIENDVEAADHVINILENDGYAVEIATDAIYGTTLAQTFLPHLILLGALSEQLTGADFMRSLRNTTGFAERSQVTPVLYLIDNNQLLQQRFQGLRDTPLTSTIFKPANERELLQKVERALNPEIDFPAETL